MAVPLFDDFGWWGVFMFAEFVVCGVSFVAWLMLHGWAPPAVVVMGCGCRAGTIICCTDNCSNMCFRGCIQYIPPSLFLFVAFIVVNEVIWIPDYDAVFLDVSLTFPVLLFGTPWSVLCLLLLVGGRIRQECQQRRWGNNSNGRDTGTSTTPVTNMYTNNAVTSIANNNANAIGTTMTTNRSDDDVLVDVNADDDDVEVGIQIAMFESSHA
jgi:hypothetical protein